VLALIAFVGVRGRVPGAIFVDEVDLEITLRHG